MCNFWVFYSYNLGNTGTPIDSIISNEKESTSPDIDEFHQRPVVTTDQEEAGPSCANQTFEQDETTVDFDCESANQPDDKLDSDEDSGSTDGMVSFGWLWIDIEIFC